MDHRPVSCAVRHGLATITLDNPPVNALSDTLRASMLATLQALDGRDDVSAVILTGKGHAFIAGADLTEMDRPPERPFLPEITQAIAAMRAPVIAAINGVCLGGGMEIALACDARFAVANAMLGFPETRLGIIPGAGGTQRLPRLIGLEAAIEMICGASTITAGASTGLVDAVVADPVAHAEAEAALVTKRDLGTGDIASLDDDTVQRLRQRWLAGRRGSEAVRAAFDLLVRSPHLPFGQALAEERETFLRLRNSDTAKALRHIFKAERRAGQIPAPAAAAPINRIAVAGGGTMGAGIAHACLAAGIDVVVLERDAEFAASARRRIDDAFDSLIKRGRLSATEAAEQLARLAVGHDPCAVAGCDLLIEAVFEDYDVKQALVDTLRPHLDPSTLIASNTSYLDIDRLSAMVADPGRFAGMHFFAPASIMKLVEVIAGAATAPETTARLVRLARRLGKIPVIAGNAEGFIGNRIFSGYRRAMEYLVEDGASPLAIDMALEDYGFAMGPFSVFDVSGLDVAWAMRKRNAVNRDPRHRSVGIADRLCEMGLFGRKTGRGWYDHSRYQRTVSAEAERLIAEERHSKCIVPRCVEPDEIIATALESMVQEGNALLKRGIASSESDIDVVMVTGYGFPREKGGPMYAAAMARGKFAISPCGSA